MLLPMNLHILEVVEKVTYGVFFINI